MTLSYRGISPGPLCGLPAKKGKQERQDHADQDRSGQRKIKDETFPFDVNIAGQPPDKGDFPCDAQHQTQGHDRYAYDDQDPSDVGHHSVKTMPPAPRRRLDAAAGRESAA